MNTLYHTSPRLITKIEKSHGVFDDVLFFSQDVYKMSEAAQYVYSIDANNISFIDYSDIEDAYYDEDYEVADRKALNRVVASVASMFETDEETAIDLLVERINSYDADNLENFDNGGEAGWYIQKMQAQAAKAICAGGCIAQDEQGSVYMIAMFEKEHLLTLA